MTNEAKAYIPVSRQLADHVDINDSAEEWVRVAPTNTLDGYFYAFRYEMKDIYQHCGEQHLHRYLSEFDSSYNNPIAPGVKDQGRAAKPLLGLRGKRLTYRRVD